MGRLFRWAQYNQKGPSKEKREAGKSKRRRCDDGSRSWSDVGLCAKERGQPLEPGKGTGMVSSLEPPEGTALPTILILAQ